MPGVGDEKVLPWLDIRQSHMLLSASKRSNGKQEVPLSRA